MEAISKQKINELRYMKRKFERKAEEERRMKIEGNQGKDAGRKAWKRIQLMSIKEEQK